MPAFLSNINELHQLEALKRLEVIQYGGESIQNDWLQKALAYGLPLYQKFGVTEQSVYSNARRMKLGDNRMIVGESYKNYQTAIVDLDGQLLPMNGYKGNKQFFSIQKFPKS